MKLQDKDIDSILHSFPLKSGELSYEIMTHKKVFNPDIILAIPEGKKCFTWFTSYKSENACFLLELDITHKIIDVKNIITAFDDSLATGTGTIFYGTIFIHNFMQCFCIEDLYYYKSKSYTKVSYLTKLETISKMFKSELSQSALNNKFVVFGLPMMNQNFSILLQDIKMLPYKISKIKHRFFDKNSSRKILTMNYFTPGNQYSINNVKNTNTSKIVKAIFKITPDIEPDIYNLFIYRGGQEEYYGLAFIPDYKTSVMMNKLFRKIKENENLDAIEESDNEEEFENEKEDRFVYLDRSFKLNCEYYHKFKKWCPVSLANQDDIIVSELSLKNLLKNY
jgi:hypothetical protein